MSNRREASAFHVPLRQENRDKCSPSYPDVTCAMLKLLAQLISCGPQGQNGGRPQWDWDGNRESPIFLRPSTAQCYSSPGRDLRRARRGT